MQLITCVLSGTLDDVEKLGVQPYKCQVVQARKLILVPSGAALKAMAGRMFDTPAFAINQAFNQSSCQSIRLPINQPVNQ